MLWWGMLRGQLWGLLLTKHYSLTNKTVKMKKVIMVSLLALGVASGSLVAYTQMNADANAACCDHTECCADAPECSEGGSNCCIFEDAE